MGKEKIHVSLVVIGHVDAGKWRKKMILWGERRTKGDKNKSWQSLSHFRSFAVGGDELSTRNGSAVGRLVVVSSSRGIIGSLTVLFFLRNSHIVISNENLN